MPTRSQAAAFAVIYRPELARYVVERGELRVVPTLSDSTKTKDPEGRERAGLVCAALNRVYSPSRSA